MFIVVGLVRNNFDAGHVRLVEQSQLLLGGDPPRVEQLIDGRGELGFDRHAVADHDLVLLGQLHAGLLFRRQLQRLDFERRMIVVVTHYFFAFIN